MNSLLEKEGMAGKVQMIYIDPPYGIKYGSNFQPFVNKKDIKDGVDEDLTQEPETVKAFRDTWELGIHSYLSYLRDRLFLARSILHESGSVFVQISGENLHHVWELVSEIFGEQNYVAIITFRKSGGQTSKWLPVISDYLVWYAKDKSKVKYHQLFVPKEIAISSEFQQVRLRNGNIRRLTQEEKINPSVLPAGARICKSTDLQSRTGSSTTQQPFKFEGRIFKPRSGAGWRTTSEGLQRLAENGRLLAEESALRYLQYLDDSPGSYLVNIWMDMMGEPERVYVVQTNTKVIERCILMTTDAGDLVLDPTCGSGTTAFASEKWGRRWITCDTSRVSVILAKQRLMTPFLTIIN